MSGKYTQQQHNQEKEQENNNTDEYIQLRAKLLFYKYNMNFKEPLRESAQADTQLKQLLGNPLKEKQIVNVHSKAYLPLKIKEKEAVYRVIFKLPVKVLKQLKGLRIAKKHCKLHNKNRYKKDKHMPVYYSYEMHEIILTNTETGISHNIFENAENIEHANNIEKNILSAIAYALDCIPRRNFYHEYNREINENKLNFEISKDALITTDKLRKEAYMNYLQYRNSPQKENHKKQYINFNKLYIEQLNKHEQLTEQNKKSLERIYNTEIANHSGMGVKYSLSNGQKIKTVIQKETEFTLALKTDQNFTAYQTAQEAFANAFTLFVLEPVSFKTQYPNMYKYFNKKYY